MDNLNLMFATVRARVSVFRFLFEPRSTAPTYSPVKEGGLGIATPVSSGTRIELHAALR